MITDYLKKKKSGNLSDAACYTTLRELSGRDESLHIFLYSVSCLILHSLWSEVFENHSGLQIATIQFGHQIKQDIIWFAIHNFCMTPITNSPFRCFFNFFSVVQEGYSKGL